MWLCLDSGSERMMPEVILCSSHYILLVSKRTWYWFLAHTCVQTPILCVEVRGGHLMSLFVLFLWGTVHHWSWSWADKLQAPVILLLYLENFRVSGWALPCPDFKWVLGSNLRTSRLHSKCSYSLRHFLAWFGLGSSPGQISLAKPCYFFKQ